MSVVDLVRARESEGVRLSRIASDAGVDYFRLWRACRGGNHLNLREEERLTRALQRTEQPHYSAAV